MKHRKVSMLIAGGLAAALICAGGYFYIQNENAKQAALIEQQIAEEKAEAERIAAEKEAAEKAEAERIAAEKAEAERIAAEKEAAEKAEAERIAAEKGAAEKQAKEQNVQPSTAAQTPENGMGVNGGTGSDGFPDDVVIGDGGIQDPGIEEGENRNNSGVEDATDWNNSIGDYGPLGGNIYGEVIESGIKVPGAN